MNWELLNGQIIKPNCEVQLARFPRQSSLSLIVKLTYYSTVKNSIESKGVIYVLLANKSNKKSVFA